MFLNKNECIFSFIFSYIYLISTLINRDEKNILFLRYYYVVYTHRNLLYSMIILLNSEEYKIDEK